MQTINGGLENLHVAIKDTISSYPAGRDLGHAMI